MKAHKQIKNLFWRQIGELDDMFYDYIHSRPWNHLHGRLITGSRNQLRVRLEEELKNEGP
jgi:hypothetical protein